MHVKSALPERDFWWGGWRKSKNKIFYLSVCHDIWRGYSLEVVWASPKVIWWNSTPKLIFWRWKFENYTFLQIWGFWSSSHGSCLHGEKSWKFQFLTFAKFTLKSWKYIILSWKKSFWELLTYFLAWRSQMFIKRVFWFKNVSRGRDKLKLPIFGLQKAFIRVVKRDQDPLK